MKQPELGRKISELRNAKGLTQEELVEKCNISVRTIQRIEAGEVTPRIYTTKTILAALDYDLSKISDNKDNIFDSLIKWLKNLMLIDIDINKPSDYLIKQLNIAWLFGVIYLMLGFFEGTAEHYRYEENRMIFSNNMYVLLKISILIMFFFFQRGFILIGSLFRNYLLRVISIILICYTIIVKGYDIASIFYDSVERMIFAVGASLTLGGIVIIYGISLNRIQKPIGRIAKYAGNLEIIAGCFFLTFALSFIGHILLIPAGLFEIIVIYKSIEIIKSKKNDVNFA